MTPRISAFSSLSVKYMCPDPWCTKFEISPETHKMGKLPSSTFLICWVRSETDMACGSGVLIVSEVVVQPRSSNRPTLLLCVVLPFLFDPVPDQRFDHIKIVNKDLQKEGCRSCLIAAVHLMKAIFVLSYPR